MESILSENDLKIMRRKNRKANELNSIVTFLRTQPIGNKATIGRNLLRDKYDVLFDDPIMGDIRSDFHTNGIMLEYPHGQVIQHAQKPFYYRGQITDYGSCTASLFRKIVVDDDETRSLKIFINKLKLEEFNNLMHQFKQVREWQFGDIFTDAIAQHYEFDTNLIDITNDLEVALFFACCRHIENNKYVPLSEEDIEKMKDPTGVLFVRNQIIDSMEVLEDPYTLSVYPIGYQPFTRCHRQKGFFVKTDFGEDLQTSGKFKLYKFNHSSKLSSEIYEKFNGGKALFSYDELESIKDLIDSIKNASTFSENVFKNVVSRDEQLISEENYRELLLRRFGVKIGVSPYSLSRQKKRAIDSQWSIDKFCKQEKIAPGFRMAYTPD